MLSKAVRATYLHGPNERRRVEKSTNTSERSHSMDDSTSTEESLMGRSSSSSPALYNMELNTHPIASTQQHRTFDMQPEYSRPKYSAAGLNQQQPHRQQQLELHTAAASMQATEPVYSPSGTQPPSQTLSTSFILNPQIPADQGVCYRPSPLDCSMLATPSVSSYQARSSTKQYEADASQQLPQARWSGLWPESSPQPGRLSPHGEVSANYNLQGSNAAGEASTFAVPNEIDMDGHNLVAPTFQSSTGVVQENVMGCRSLNNNLRDHQGASLTSRTPSSSDGGVRSRAGSCCHANGQLCCRDILDELILQAKF